MGKWKHKMSRSPEYKAYTQALYRCTNPNEQAYECYGGRGIRFLFESFDQFYKELGPRPSGMELDRINNNGDYAPGNVRWATRLQQVINRRYKLGATGYRGVRKHKNKFTAQITNDYKNTYLGLFNTAEEAAAAYQEAVRRTRG